MSREEILALAGVLIGLPSFALLIVSGQVVIGVLVLVLIGGVIGVTVLLGQPQFTLLEVEKVLTFHDATAHMATLVRTQKARANQNGLTDFWIRNISADGSIENIQIDNHPPDDERHIAGDIQVCKRFPHPLKRGQIFTMVLSYDLIDSFSQLSEAVSHIVEVKTKKLQIIVHFHEAKPCLTASAFLRFGGQINKELPKPALEHRNRRAEHQGKRLKLGGEYSLEWDW
jgi:hypothetical protein